MQKHHILTTPKCTYYFKCKTEISTSIPTELEYTHSNLGLAVWSLFHMLSMYIGVCSWYMCVASLYFTD